MRRLLVDTLGPIMAVLVNPAYDYEYHTRSRETMLYLAMIHIIGHRLGLSVVS